ncbi:MULTISPECIES: hypothetical protein [unclassified Sphingopyxis]|uniref:hypothetical protein n=1 Tax=unclassified Sphingopyxis TaxID=2614943 RepID=UPI0006C38CDA|nr:MULTISPECIES: hypothetical protein [unclassified Sphingopyxis]USI75872.1 hypothetical protein KEC45_13970 [Sphingopyxis sp. USTB-05]GAO77589.1 hypothetical protein SC1_00880 [Sphingopyxis sp. C-1]
MTGQALPYGPSFGLGILLPVTAVLLVSLVIAARRAGSVAGAFVVVALWMRYTAGAYHLYMFKPLAAGLSGNALLSIGVTAFGLLFVVRPANLALKWLLPVYALILLALVSAGLNGDAAGGINAAVKYAYMIVIMIAVFQALRVDPEARFLGWAMVSFLPLLVFQMLSLALNLPKGSEDGDGLVWIGGYNHEAAFSVAMMTGFLVGCFAKSAPRAVRVAFLTATFVGVLLAGYRTTILAFAPLALAVFLSGLTMSVRRDQRAAMAVSAAVAGVLFVSVAALFYSEKFTDLAAFLADPAGMIKPPRDFDLLERQVMSARPLIWSSYIYAWAEGTPIQHLFGLGPESWEGVFKVYPHNTLVATLYELGWFGIGAMVTLWTAMFAAAASARGERFKLLAAHFAFFLLNMATMPFWQVEGLALYGLLCGYTIHAARAAPPRVRALQLARG